MNSPTLIAWILLAVALVLWPVPALTGRKHFHIRVAVTTLALVVTKETVIISHKAVAVV